MIAIPSAIEKRLKLVWREEGEVSCHNSLLQRPSTEKHAQSKILGIKPYQVLSI